VGDVMVAPVLQLREFASRDGVPIAIR